MKKRKVIKSTNTRIKNPIAIGVLFYLLFKETNAPDWLYGLVGGLLGIVLISCIWDFFNTTEVDIFEDKNPIKL